MLRRSLLVVLVLFGYLVMLVVSVPVAYLLGIGISGWERPEGIVQGWEANPLSGAFWHMLLVWCVLVVAGTVGWWKLLRRVWR